MSVTNTKPHDGDFWATPKVVKEALSELIKNKNITAIDPCYGTGINIDTHQMSELRTCQAPLEHLCRVQPIFCKDKK